jgi:uncharacterized SAM-binding protein YcdF (DUF218 family)
MELTFLLKKIITMFIMPFPIAILLFIFGIVLFYKHKYSKAKIVLTTGMVWLFLISYSPLVNSILYRYEVTYPALKTAPRNIKYIYVLGGGNHTDEALPITSQVVEASVVRITEAIRLYHQLNEKPIIIVSGYNGLHDPTPGAVMQERLALALGVKKDKLHMEPTPKDTQDEAVAAKKYIGDDPFILVTSASHMKRAMKFFENEGLHPLAAPTNHLANIKYPNYNGFFSVTALRKTNVVWHEILGLIWQKIKGI